MSYEMKSMTTNKTNQPEITLPASSLPIKRKRKTKNTPSIGDTNPELAAPNESDLNNPTIKQIIHHENLVNDAIEQIHSQVSSDETKLLEHLEPYIEEPYNIIESYFGGKHLERLVRHQLESYNNFVNFQIHRTIQMFNPVRIRSDNVFCYV